MKRIKLIWCGLCSFIYFIYIVYVYVYMDINTSKCMVWVERSGSFYHGFSWSSSGYQVEPPHFPCLVCLRNMKLVCTVSQNDVG